MNRFEGLHITSSIAAGGIFYNVQTGTNAEYGFEN